ncbi:Zn-dependent protease [Elusimicrobium simillimum]|uniref:site-2 protease family protein n=1 Tax=Elusimicrobium simillimum TaxID=3143438 RepID=UPI003C6FF4FB
MAIIFIQISILFLSVVLHEIAHGYTAYRRGDDTAYLMGRLTLNPVSHVDIFGTIVMPVLCYISGLPMFGWAKPVPVNTTRLHRPRHDMGVVAAAGPLTNISIALVLAIVLKISFHIDPSLIFTVNETNPNLIGQTAYMSIMTYGVLINILLAVFNMIPVLPLDGGRVLSAILPINMSDKYAQFERYGLMVIMAFVVFGGGRLLSPVVNFAYSALIYLIIGVRV